MTELVKYNENEFALPSVVDYIDYEKHAAIDIIQVKGELFRKEDELEYNGVQMIVIKVVKKYPIQTEYEIKNRLDILKVRYFCSKIKNNE